MEDEEVYNGPFLNYFPIEYSNYTENELFSVVCETCGETFGFHSGDICPVDSIFKKDGRFVAPSLMKINTNILPDDLFVL